MRRLVIFAAAVSVVLGVAAGALWVRSYHYYDILKTNLGDRLGGAHAYKGEMLLYYDDFAVSYERPGWISIPANLGVDGGFADRCRWRFAGFGIDEAGGKLRSHYGYVVVFPHWSVVALAAMLPVWWCVRSWRAQRRNLSGLCATCGYDLRATPDRCPECGTMAEQGAASTNTG